ncbi:MAG TPA: AAA family ATPase, partial [Candidatus Limnocylindria bacterium]|nr:AAA family ATPase [Candidatus Limnocylindria bacterium]
MSRLRELRVHGFKSFAEPTRFVFEPGVNAVIGPNGSGKSNMADAVRWVLGEQSNRSLRTRRAEDVIFAGSDARRAMGMAEVILTLDNADGWLPLDFAEVTVGRRAYRSGETEYLVNGARARLRDVVELLGEGRLGANELVVVGQGTVDAALSLRPEERRQLFEEAAGVKNLQVKRNEASGRLAKARDHLSRVGDLLAELRPQVRRLALQAQHQQEHDELLGRARGLIVESHRRRETSARTALGDARRRAAAAEAELADQRARDEVARRAAAEAEEGYWAAESAARAAAEEHGRTREARIRIEARLEGLSTRRDQLQAELGRARQEQAAARQTLAEEVDADDPIGDVLGRAAAAEERWRDSIARLADADAELLAAEEALAALRHREASSIAAAARSDEERARIQARLEELERELDTARAGRVPRGPPPWRARCRARVPAPRAGPGSERAPRPTAPRRRCSTPCGGAAQRAPLRPRAARRPHPPAARWSLATSPRRRPRVRARRRSDRRRRPPRRASDARQPAPRARAPAPLAARPAGPA